MKCVFYKNCLLLKMIYILTLIYALCISKSLMDYVMVGVSCVLPFVFPVLFKFLKLKMTKEIKVINISFIYFASLIGSCLGGYELGGFDKLVHFTSGLIVFVVGMFIYESWIGHKINNVRFKYCFCHLFTISVAVLWEFYEYFMLIVFQNDCIHHYDTGVHDSITDMICGVIGGLVIYLFVRYANISFVDQLIENVYKNHE